MTLVSSLPLFVCSLPLFVCTVLVWAAFVCRGHRVGNGLAFGWCSRLQRQARRTRYGRTSFAISVRFVHVSTEVRFRLLLFNSSKCMGFKMYGEGDAKICAHFSLNFSANIWAFMMFLCSILQNVHV